MRVTLVAPSYARRTSGLERHVTALGAGLLRHGIEVELLTPRYGHGAPSVSEVDGVVVRRFRVPVGDGRLAAAVGLREHLRRSTRAHRIVHLHGGSIPLGLAVMRAHPAPLVFTPHEASQRLARWPHAHMTRALVARAVQTLCASEAEAALMRRAFPRAADGIRIVPHAADVAAIRAARPFAVERQVVLAVGRLSRRRHFDRAIAAMAGLDPALMLVIVGDGPARRSLQAHAHDLEVSSQVRFVRRVSEEGLYRWLRTARAFVSLGDEEVVDPELLEVFAAGIPVVASDTSAHREAAPRVPGAALLFVSPEGSPFEIADAIGEAVRRGPMLPPRATVPSWNAVVKRTLGIYEELASGPPLSAQHQRSHRPLDSVAEG